MREVRRKSGHLFCSDVKREKRNILRTINNIFICFWSHNSVCYFFIAGHKPKFLGQRSTSWKSASNGFHLHFPQCMSWRFSSPFSTAASITFCIKSFQKSCSIAGMMPGKVITAILIGLFHRLVWSWILPYLKHLATAPSGTQTRFSSGLCSKVHSQPTWTS